MQDWVNLISSVGFPIVCCFMLWQFQKTTLKDFSDRLSENTEMMARLYEKIDNVLFGGNNDDKTNLS